MKNFKSIVSIFSIFLSMLLFFSNCKKEETTTTPTITQYTVTFDVNSGTAGAGTDYSQKINSGANAAKPVNDPTKSEYTFLGWFEAASGGTAITTFGPILADKKYYAQWSSKQYTVTFDVNGGTAGAGADYSQKINSGANAAKPVNNPTKSEYTFLGWFEAASGGTAITTFGPISADKKYYAQWGKKYISEIKIGGNLAAQITYNTDNLVSEVKKYRYTLSNSPLYSTTTFIYTNKKLTSKTEIIKDDNNADIYSYTYTYTYQDNSSLIATQTEVFVNLQETNTTTTKIKTFGYDASNRVNLITITLTTSDNKTLIREIRQRAYIADGFVDTYINPADNIPKAIINYKTDTKINPLYIIHGNVPDAGMSSLSPYNATPYNIISVTSDIPQANSDGKIIFSLTPKFTDGTTIIINDTETYRLPISTNTITYNGDDVATKNEVLFADTRITTLSSEYTYIIK